MRRLISQALLSKYWHNKGLQSAGSCARLLTEVLKESSSTFSATLARHAQAAAFWLQRLSSDAQA